MRKSTLIMSAIIVMGIILFIYTSILLSFTGIPFISYLFALFLMSLPKWILGLLLLLGSLFVFVLCTILLMKWFIIFCNIITTNPILKKLYKHKKLLVVLFLLLLLLFLIPSIVFFIIMLFYSISLAGTYNYHPIFTINIDTFILFFTKMSMLLFGIVLYSYHYKNLYREGSYNRNHISF